MNKILNISPVLMAGILWINTSQAQVRFSSLQEIWQYADAHNITLQTAAANSAMARASVKEAYGALLPSVTANGNFTDNLTLQPTLIPANLFNSSAPADTYVEARFGRQYMYNASVTAQLHLLQPADWFMVKAARLNATLADLNIEQSRRTLYEQLASAYYSCLLLQEAEKLSVANLETATAVYEVANNKFRDGLVSEVTVNSALINQEKAASNLSVARENRQIQLNNLRDLLQLKDSIDVPVVWPRQALRTDTVQFVADPAVSLANVQMQLSQNDWKAAKAAYIPTLSAIYQYNTQVVGDEFLKFGNTNTLPQQYWGLRLSVPIFSGNSRRYELQKARIGFNNSRQQLENAQLHSAIEQENVLIAYNSARNAFDSEQKILTLYQDNDQHATRLMNGGVLSLDERLRYFTDLVAQQQAYLQSMSDYFIQQYRLQLRQTSFEH